MRALAAGLKKAREATDISARELSRRLKLSPGLVALWESGRRVPRVEHVAMALAILGTAPDERDRLFELARLSKSEPNWLTVGVPGISEQLVGTVESERAASKIIQWSPSLIPGLLQTSEYMRVILSRGGRDQVDIDGRLMLRVGRREVITRRNPVEFVAFIGEAALRDPVVEPDLMADQLRYLVEMSGKKNIDLRIVPSCIGWHPGSAGPFVLYEFPDSGPVLHFEHYSSGAFVPDESNIKDYQSAIEILTDVAKNSRESVELIKTITKGWANNHE
jgi:transcriptional regulator with XRE-family HTH domain